MTTEEIRSKVQEITEHDREICFRADVSQSWLVRFRSGDFKRCGHDMMERLESVLLEIEARDEGA